MENQNMPIRGQGFAQPENSQGDINSADFAAIVPVIAGHMAGRETSIVSAKALHGALGVGRDFSNWIKGRIAEYGFVEGVDFLTFETPIMANQSSNIDQAGSDWVTKRGGNRRSKDYLLSLNMAKETAMIENNEQGRAARRYFIQCEEALRISAPEIAAKYRRQLKARIGAASMFKPMCAALEAARAEQGKQTQQRHYSNESNMIAKMVLGGLTAKQWAQANDIDGEPRDGMNATQLDHLTYLESTNITLIEMGMDYHQRKAELLRLSQRWLAKRVEAINE